MSNKTQLQNNNTALDGYIARINAAKDVAAGLPEAGGSGGGIEYEIVNLTQEGTSIPFTLKRVTSTFGMMTTSGQGGLSTKNAAHYNLSGMSANYMGGVSSFLRNLFFEEGVLTSSSNFIAPYMAVFINDPSAEAIYEE